MIDDPVSKIERFYGLIGSRLSETKQAFVISKALNEAFGGELSAELAQKVDDLRAVAWPILWSCQVATFTGLVAVLEKSEGSASIPELARLIRLRGGVVPTELEEEIGIIFEKNRTFRNKLFTHNSIHRERIQKEFNSLKISWETMAKDFETVERVFFQVSDCSPELSLQLGPLMLVKDVQDTEATIQDLIAKFKG